MKKLLADWTMFEKYITISGDYQERLKDSIHEVNKLVEMVGL